jgi:hypothetical protein
VLDDLRVLADDLAARGLVERDVVERDVLEDFFEPDRRAFVSPFSARILLTVRAATSSARPP